MDRGLRRNTLILVSSLAAVLVIYLVAFLFPQRRHAQDLRSAIRQKQAEIDRCKLAATKLVMVNADLALLETANKRAAEQIPPSMNVREFLATVHGLGNQTGLTISNVTPGVISDLVGIQQQSISLSLIGQFRPVMHLIHELETMGRLVELGDLDIRAADRTGESQLEIKMTVRLFACPPKSPPSTHHSS